MESMSTYRTTGEALAHLEPNDTEHTTVSGRQYGDIGVDGSGFTVVGDAYFNGTPPNPVKSEDLVKHGLCFGSAPQLESNLFVGRDAELEKMRQILRPEQHKQQRLILGGIGGIGKTQLAITYAERYQQGYDSVFWLNANSQATLHADLRLVAGRLLRTSDLERLTDEQVLARVHEWLSNIRNTRWLLIFDSHDEPPRYEISKYCPYAAHGTIIITTRLPDCVRFSGGRMHVQPLTNLEESLDLLSRRCEREDVQADKYARLLAKRLSGLPLALATAGAYLSKSPSMTFQQYLEAYTQRWNVDSQWPLELQEYQDRTLYTTWDLSYTRLESEDAHAAQLLKFLAYFNNQNISYELLSGTAHLETCFSGNFRENSSRNLESFVLLNKVLQNKIYFAGAMRTLIRYCFIETQGITQSYSMHNCVHDWTLATLNKTPDKSLYWYAMSCVVVRATDCPNVQSMKGPQYAQLATHAARLTHTVFMTGLVLDEIISDRLTDTGWITVLLVEQSEFTAAEQICKCLLTRLEKLLGPLHVKSLQAMRNLGRIYRVCGRFDEAKAIHTQALARKEKTLGLNNISTLRTIYDLGFTYHDQGKMDDAGMMYKLALARIDPMSGLDNVNRLKSDLLHRLADMYYYQARFDDSENLYNRVLAMEPKATAFNHNCAIHNIGLLHHDQGRFREAERMYSHALAGFTKLIGAQHTRTLVTFSHLGNLFRTQGRWREAAEIHMQVLVAREKTLGATAVRTIWSQACLGAIYFELGRSSEAASLLHQVRAADGRGLIVGGRISVADALYDLAILYEKHCQLEEAESTYRRALEAHKKWFAPSYPRARRVVDSLMKTPRQRGKYEEAAELEQSYIDPKRLTG